MPTYSADFLTYCSSFSLTLTSLRKAVLYALWQTEKPLKAYDILGLLRDEQPNLTAAAIYRALSFFMAAGLLHKIDSIQAYALCNKPEIQACSDILMVCSSCHAVREMEDAVVRDALTRVAALDTFQLGHEPIELRGTCESCSI